MKPRFLIVNAYSARNAGDAAIVLATAAVLQDLTGGSVASASRYCEQDRDYYAPRGIRVVPPVIPFAPRPAEGSGRTRVLSFALSTPVVFLLAALARLNHGAASRIASRLPLPGFQELLANDRVVICGGGYLYSYHRALNLTLLHATLCVKLAQLAGKRPLMMPQSIGPLHRALDQRLVRWAFRDVEPVVARDELARAEAEALMPSARVELCPDIAFYGWNASADSPSAPPGPSVGIVVMDWTWARKVDPTIALDEYVAKLARVSRSLADHGIAVRLYGHSRIPEMDQDDVAVADRVEAAVGMPHVTVDPEGASGDADTLHKLFGQLDVVIGTRLHSCIVAMSAGTPAVGLAYQPKTTGTFDLLGLSSLAFDVETFDADEIAALALRLVDATEQRDEVIAQVAATRERILSFYDRALSACA